ncbi:MAG: phospholipase D-like domain-containing protein [Ignavibacteriales bacterium]|nr:phospholipase D-like domain-containing protein [Ignavibacteriales bacterium]
MRLRVLCAMFGIVLSAPLFGQVADHIVISEVYGGGGNSGSTWKNDFVELYNPTNAPVTLVNWSVQYASATGSFGTTNLHVFSGIIQPKSFFLIQEAPGAGGTKDLPAPDATGILALSGTQGKVALSSGSTPVTGPTDPSVVDFVGYGVASSFEGSGPAPLLSNTTSAERKASATSTDVTLGPGGSEEKSGNGRDTNNNAGDFVAQSNINPQNSATPKEPPPAIQAGIGVASVLPLIAKADTGIQATIILHGVSDAPITGLRFAKHPLLDWSRASFSVTVSNGGQSLLQQTRDSVKVTGFTITAIDSIMIRIAGLAAPDTTVKILFSLESGAGSDSTALVTPLPSFVLYGNPQAVAVVKVNDPQGIPLNLQRPVSVRGIVTAAKEFGGPAYIQDGSGGLAVFDQTFENAVKIGDEVTITGTITQFNGLTELAGVTLHKINSSGNEVIPVVVTCAQLTRDGSNGIEFYEGMLVQLNRVTVRNALGQPVSVWGVSGSGSNFWLRDETDSIQVRIDGDVTSIANTPAPAGEFDLVGVVGQFVATPPFVGGYQVMPRFSTDIFSKGPVITVLPLERSITPTGFDVQWETAKPGSNYARYGRTRAYELGVIGNATPQTVHRITLSGLSPATTYHVQAYSVSGTDTSFAGDRVISTASQGSTGQINVYFNKSVNTSLARGDTAKGNANLTELLVRRINAAKKSIDCALYSMSGQVGQTIASALSEAWRRGVKVRFIIERDNMSAGTGTTINQYIVPAGIPWITDDYDAVNGGVGLHHNKFLIIDYRGGTPDQAWVWTGSWNLTDSGTNDDYQNAIEIQDQSLAGAYTAEFNEMWGSDSTTSNAANSRFGARKLDNTPHVFNVNGTPVELYFSPSDRTTSHILSTLAKAQNSINVALLTLTRSDIAGAMKSKKDAGVRVRGVLDNGTDTGSQYSFLTTGGVDIRLKSNTPGLLHHKYGIVDAEVTTAAQYVITGSHNWTSAAETSNNENALIIQSNRIANQYLQEFAARYKDAGGADKILVGVDRADDQVPSAFSLSQNYPNPFNPTTAISYQLTAHSFVNLVVFDVLGREVSTLVNDTRRAGTHIVHWDSSSLPSGVYFYRLNALPVGNSRTAGFVETKKMVFAK